MKHDNQEAVAPVNTSSYSIIRPSPAETRSSRALACVFCHQRKIKCDRHFPCNNCARARTKCVPSTQASYQRRRRFPEKDLLNRLRQYEILLKENNVPFEPLHSNADGTLPNANVQQSEGAYDAARPITDIGATSSQRAESIKSETTYEATDIWRAMYQESTDDDEDTFTPGDENSDTHVSNAVRQAIVKRHMDEAFDRGGCGQLFFGVTSPGIDLKEIRPTPARVFQLWQIYSNNVDPLLKVTHSISLQTRIIDASGDLTKVTPSFEALLFGVYTSAVASMTEERSLSVFGSSRAELLELYQLGAEQALSNADFMRSTDRDCLTGFFLYLVALTSAWGLRFNVAHTQIAGRTLQDPRAQSVVMGSLVRLAQHMGLHLESKNRKYPPFECEMRRRLWWSITSFDARCCERADFRGTSLTPTWDCRIPSNVNDFDLRPDMKSAPPPSSGPTQALFVVLRSDLLDRMRRSDFHLDFVNPALRILVPNTREGSEPDVNELDGMEALLEQNYFSAVDMENPLHFLTVWFTKGYVTRCRLLQYYARVARTNTTPSTQERNFACRQAIHMIEYDNIIIQSSISQGFTWHVNFHFPFISYLHLIQDMRRRPSEEHVPAAWKAMSTSHTARGFHAVPIEHSFVRIIAGEMLEAWDLCERTWSEKGQPLQRPDIVVDVKQRYASKIAKAENSGTFQDESLTPGGTAASTDASKVEPATFVAPMLSTKPHKPQQAPLQGLPDIFAPNAMDFDVGSFGPAMMDWSNMFGVG